MTADVLPIDPTAQPKRDPTWHIMSIALLSRAMIAQWATLLMSFALFAICVAWRPEPLRIVGASLFTLFVHVPLWWRAQK